MVLPPLHLALAWVVLLTGMISFVPARADVTKPSGAPVNTETRPRGRERREPEPTSPTPEDRLPVIEPKRLKLLRGETIPITLDSVEDSISQRVRYFIRDEPKAGFLSELKEPAEDLSIATLTYSSDPASTAKTDQFTFAAQYPFGRVATPVPIILEIVEPTPVIQAVPALDFGRTVLGAESVRTIVLTNSGTAAFELDPVLDPPWGWVLAPGEKSLRIPPGQAAPATFAFRPSKLGGFVFRLPLPTGLPDKPGVLFTGEGVVPFTAEPETILLDFDAKTRRRSARVVLTNPGPEGVTVLVASGDRLESPAGNRIWLEKEARKELLFALPAKDASAFQGQIHFESSGYQRSVQAGAPATPGFLALTGVDSSLSLDLGKVFPGESAEAVVKLRNTGGQAVSANFQPPKPPFHARRLSEASGPQEIAPGAEIAFAIAFQPEAPQMVRDQLILSAPGQEFVVTLRAECVAVPSKVEVTATTNMTGGGMASGPGGTISHDTVPAVVGPVGSQPSGSGDYSSMFGATAVAPAGVGTAAGRQILQAEIPKAVTGRNGELALPPMISSDGLLAFSPHKLKTDVKLPTVPLFRVHHSTERSALLVWPRPQDKHSLFQVEVRATSFNREKQRPECIWIPISKVKFTVADTYVTADVFGLRPDSYYMFRVFAMGQTGTNSLPSKEAGVRTLRSSVSLSTFVNVGMLAMVIAAGGGIYLLLRRNNLL